MSANKVVNLLLGLLVQVLKFVHGGKLGDVQTVWQHAIWLALEQMLRFVGRDVGDSSENVAGMRSSPLNAVSVVNTTLSSLSVDIEVLEIVVEIDRSSTQVSSKKSGVGSKNGCDINASLLAEWKSYTSQPFVEVSNDRGSLFAGNVLEQVSHDHLHANSDSYLPQEPCYQVTEHNGLVSLIISWR